MVTITLNTTVLQLRNRTPKHAASTTESNTSVVPGSLCKQEVVSSLEMCGRGYARASKVSLSSMRAMSIRHARRFSTPADIRRSPALVGLDLNTLPYISSQMRFRQAHTTSSMALRDWKVQKCSFRVVILAKKGRRMRSNRRGGPWSKWIWMNCRYRRLGKERMKSSPAVRRSGGAQLWMSPSMSVWIMVAFGDVRIAVVNLVNF